MEKINYYHKKLEFDCLLSQLVDLATIDLVKEHLLSIEPSNDLEYLNNVLDQVDEALCITTRIERAPIMISKDFYQYLNITSKNGILSALELYETIRLYNTVRANQKLLISLNKENIPAPFYTELVSQLILHENFNDKLRMSIDENGEVLDEASGTLKNIRQKLRNIDGRIRSKFQEIINREGSKLSQTTITIRNGHYCLPVKAEYKNSFPGVIIDQSATMQTIFMEPHSIISLVVEKDKLFNDEKEEIERILKNLSMVMYEYDEELRRDFDIICYLDELFAKAVLAQKYDGTRPTINNQGHLNLVNARHPLLKVKKVIPNNISFGNDYYGIIITGPNTGGKTVLIKTVGLLSLMVKYGLLIPADSSSNVMIYDQIFCDIGDDQSIQNNLSTFSSHIGNIAKIIDVVTPHSLVLFDEIGSGTDPIEGSNLAIAILKFLINNHVSFITTTHYSELKTFAFNEMGIINASMEFNEETLSPTYRLVLGISGSSNAFNIARRLGLKDEIINEATNMMIASDTDVRKLIIKLENEYHSLEDERRNLAIERQSLKKVKDEYDQKMANIDKKERQILKNAENKAKEIVDKIILEARQILDQVTLMKNKEVKMHEIIEQKTALNRLEPTIEIPEKPKEKENQVINIGDDVYVERYLQYGVVQKVLKNGQYQVQIGNIVIRLSHDEIEKVTNKKSKETEGETIVQYATTRANISLSLDLRGCRYEEAKDKLEKYLDDLLCANLKQATIIHGYGTGVIREMVQTVLKNNKNVQSFHYGGENDGGFGVTIVVMK